MTLAAYFYQMQGLICEAVPPNPHALAWHGACCSTGTTTCFTHFCNGINFKYHRLQARIMDFIVLLCYCHMISLTYSFTSLVASCV